MAFSVLLNKALIVELLPTPVPPTNKTFTFVPNIEITWDYIRGVFEGDGYLRRKEVNITGASKLHIEAICNFVKSCGIRCTIRTKTTPQGTTMYDFEIHNKEGINQFLDNIF